MLDLEVAGQAAATSPREPVARFVGIGYVIAFFAVTVAGFAQAATTPGVLATHGALPALAAVSAGFALLGTLGLHLAEQRGSRPAVHLVLAGLAVLGAGATLASQGYASMLLLAVVSVGVLHLGSRASVAVTAAASLVALIAFGERDPLWSAFVQAEVTFGSGVAFVFVFSRIARRERRARGDNERLVAELAAANARLTAQAKHAEQLARAEERNRIAREIHDGLGHYLTVVHIQLEAARSTLASDPERALAALTRSQQLTHEGLCEVRRSVALLRGSAPLRPLLEALGALVDDSVAAGVATELRVEGTPRRLAEPIEFTLYRAAQEALTNARRHARASQVSVALAFADAGVRLRVEDDGIGAGDPGDSAGFGLRGMRERAEVVGGTLAVMTAPDRGFAIELEVPG
jgi:signal transduction histidine kinase